MMPYPFVVLLNIPIVFKLLWWWVALAGYLLEPDYMFLVAAMFFVLSK
jgi:hypothetical protein